MNLADAARILLERREARQSFQKWCEIALRPLGLTPAPHHRLLISELQKVADGETKRLMVFMPPGSAKSTYTSVLFPPFLFARQRNLRIIGASHTDDFAQKLSRAAQGMVRDNWLTLGYGITREPAQLWETTNGGEYRAAGAGGTITGSRADFALIDDPIKGREEAENVDQRDKKWSWFLSDLRTRLKPDAAIALIQTRWNEDDLGGRLLETQKHRWKVLSLPATALENDPLGRLPGELLWDNDPTYAYGDNLRQIRTEYEETGAMRDWWSLYEQSPRAATGALFQVDKLETIDTEPTGGVIARGWDLAATKQIGTRNPDWTVGVKVKRTMQGRFVVLDVVRLRGGPDEVQAAIVNTARMDGVGVQIGLPQDPGQAGKQQVLHLTRSLAGFTVLSSVESGDKATRAAPAASQVNVGNFSVLRGEGESPAMWIRPFIAELASFPSGTKDDQVDALSRAFAMVSGQTDYAARFAALSS
jgi:predicted phage terminase large subunit-like protein